jgi:predicted peptidase
VVFPQSLRRSWQAEGEDSQRALAIVDEICQRYAIDSDRIYLTGLSMGGGGTWSLAAAAPERWAAIAPVCGYGDPGWAPRLAPLPCWCFHGALDEVIAVEQSRRMVQALRQAGGQPHYTEYPDAGHNAWDRAYAADEFFTWLLQQQRSPTTRAGPALGP